MMRRDRARPVGVGFLSPREMWEPGHERMASTFELARRGSQLISPATQVSAPRFASEPGHLSITIPPPRTSSRSPLCIRPSIPLSIQLLRPITEVECFDSMDTTHP